MAIDTRELSADYVVLDPQQRAIPVTRTDTLCKELDERFNAYSGHWLTAVRVCDEGWPTREMHPAGDELVALLSGGAALVLETHDGEQSFMLTRPGSYVLVPRGVWHTARIAGSARLLFATPGAGTENRPV
jgi:mannose-6-phosphate isomerase-like protein (cupin superfamily)